MNNTTTNNQTLETSKKDQYKVSSIIKKIDNYEIRFNHPAQRESEQWSIKMKSNLISDILQNNPVPAIILAEQISDNGSSIVWNLDGKQRCTNIYSYVRDGFKINKSVRRNIIRYQSNARDEDGKLILENGSPIREWKEFDIVNKKFSQLPEELQDRILDYSFDATLYLNCSSDDIIYHIARYNDGKPMNQAQKGIIRLGEEFANRVKEISNSDFFTEHGTYTVKEDKSGVINRVVAETVMAENFINDWKKNQEEMCEYIRNNATNEMFDIVENEIEALEEIIKEEHDVLFSSKDSFVWFTAFHNAMENGVSEEEFSLFLSKCIGEYRDIDNEGLTLNILDENRNTKDKSVIIKKINHIEHLLNMFVSESIAA